MHGRWLYLLQAGLAVAASLLFTAGVSYATAPLGPEPHVPLDQKPGFDEQVSLKETWFLYEAAVAWDTPYSLTLTATPEEIPVGGSQSLIKARVTNQEGQPVADGTEVTFSTTAGTITPTLALTLQGSVTSTLSSGTVPLTASVTARAGEALGQTRVVFVPGPPDTVALVSGRDRLSVGNSTAVTATVRDRFANPVRDGTVVTFTTSIGEVTPGQVLTAQGLATTTLRSTRSGVALLAAYAGPVSGTLAVTFDPGPPMSVTVQAEPVDIAVDGATSLVTATVTDGYGNLVSDGTVVTLTTTLGDIEPSRGLTASGQVTATLISGATPGQAVVWATADSHVGSTTVTFHPANVSIIKQVWPSREIQPDQILTYTLTFRNGGLATARAVAITDYLPVQLIEPNVISSGVPITVAQGRPFEWHIGDLAPGRGGIITITARLDPAYPWLTSQSLFNEATISTVTAEGNYKDNRNGALVLVVTADLYLIKELTSASITFVPRAVVRYHITVGNSGPVVPQSIVITDTIPEHTSWFSDTSAQEGFSRILGDGTVTWATDVLTHSASIILWLEVDEHAPGGAVLVNRAEVSSSTVDSDMTNNKAQAIPATVHALNLRVAKDAMSHAEPGQVLTYTITYQNIGTLPAVGVVLADVLPAPVSFVRASPAPSSGDNGTYVWALGEIRTGAAGTIELAGRISPDTAVGTVLTNTVAISATLAESYQGDNRAQATTTVVAGRPHTVVITAEPETLTVAGRSAVITATVEDAWGNGVEDGTLVRLSTTLGTITPAATTTTRGVVTAALDPGTVSGVADVTASADGAIGTTQVTIRPGPAAQTVLGAEPAWPTVDDGITVTLTVRDQYANAVADGTPATFTTTLGVITPTLTATTAGRATATLTSTVPGTALVTATIASLPPQGITVTIQPGAPFTVSLTADPPGIEVGGSSTVITASVHDRFDNAVADSTVVTYTTDLGTIHGGRVYTTTTSGGLACAVLTSGKPGGTATVRVSVGGVMGEISIPFTGYSFRVYLPLTLRGYYQER